MKTLLLLLVGAIATQAKAEDRSYVYEAHVWDQANFYGNALMLNEPVPYLDNYGFDNTIESVRVTGVWLFYDNPEYNTYEAGYVHYTWGIEQEETFHDYIINKASSVRYAGSPLNFNEDGYNLYEGTFYTNDDYYGNHDIPDLSSYHLVDVSSVIIIGRSSWTFYEGTYYSGNHACLHPTDYDENYYARLDVGFYSNIQSSHSLSNVRSVRQGCHY